MEPSADWRGDADIIAEMGRRLREARFPVDRLVLFRRSLHPEIIGRATAWAPERPIEIFERSLGLDLSIGFFGSPLDRAMTEGRPQRLPSASFERPDWQWARPFQGLGLTLLEIRPLCAGAALAAATSLPRDFLMVELDLLDRLTKALRPKAGKAT